MDSDRNKDEETPHEQACDQSDTSNTDSIPADMMVDPVEETVKEDNDITAEVGESEEQKAELSLSLLNVSKNDGNTADVDVRRQDDEQLAARNDVIISVDETADIEQLPNVDTQDNPSRSITLQLENHRDLPNMLHRSCCYRLAVMLMIVVLGGFFAYLFRGSPVDPLQSAHNETARQLLVAPCKNAVIEKTHQGENLNYVVRLRFKPRDTDANEISNAFLEIFDDAGKMLGSTDLINGHQLMDGDHRIFEFVTEIRLSPSTYRLSNPQNLLGKWSWQKGKWGDPKGWHSASEDVDIEVFCSAPAKNTD